MPRYAIIKDDIIENVIVADADFINVYYPDAIECPVAFGVGDKYENETFIKLDNPQPEDDTKTL